jgi:hypothetical protein
MKRLVLFVCSAFALACAWTPRSASAAGGTERRLQSQPDVVSLPGREVDRGTLDDAAATGQTLPVWNAKIVSPLDGKTYYFHIVGTNPQTNPVKTTIPYVPILLRIHFPNGAVLDPTQPACGDTISVAQRFFGGPNFVSTPLVSNGFHVGDTQLGDAFMRAEFWSYAKNTPYGVVLKAAAAQRVVDVDAPKGSLANHGVCLGTAHDYGEIALADFDKLVQTIDKKYVKPSQLAINVTYNVLEPSHGCCVVGYHSTYAVAGGGTQVYAAATYNDAGLFAEPIEDITTWTATIGGTLNDPFGNNAVPLWGHVGQDPKGCQGNLEVGDPLTGTSFQIADGKFTYHPQDLAFFSWFYRSEAIGTGGLASFIGTFGAGQKTVCKP